MNRYGSRVRVTEINSSGGLPEAIFIDEWKRALLGLRVFLRAEIMKVRWRPAICRDPNYIIPLV